MSNVANNVNTFAPRPAAQEAARRNHAPTALAYRDIALTGIYEISKVLTSARSLESALANIIAILSSFMQMRRGMILILDEHGDPEIAASAGLSTPKPLKSGTLVPQRVIDQIVATQMPLVIESIADHTLFKGTAYLHVAPPRQTISFIGVPIKVDGVVKGTLSIDREWDGKFDFRLEDDVRFLTMITNLVGQTVRLHTLVSTDRDRLISEKHQLEKALLNVTAERGAGGPVMRAIPGAIVGESPVMRTLLEKIDMVARSNTTVLLRGETGTGKELFAKAIHEHSPRKSGPFIKVNCAALPESVIESELFGHEKGSFTGAVGQRKGRFELAHGGTLFLDEIGEISPAFQAKLLRVLQEGEFERVGGTQTIKVDIRLVCATNKHLERAVEQGQFRADLYYRINVVTLVLPPLRERSGDIPRLATRFLGDFSKENKRKISFAPNALDILSHCYFPGNVRELENCVRRTASLAMGEEIRATDLSCKQGTCLSATLWKGHMSAAPVSHHPGPTAASSAIQAPTMPAPTMPEPIGGITLPILNVADDARSAPAACPSPNGCPVTQPQQSERERLVDAMEKTGWVQAKAARLMGLTPRQIGYALRKHGIEMKHL